MSFNTAHTELPPAYAALLPALKRMGLITENTPLQLTPLTGGVSSLIVKVQTADTQFCVKRALPQLKVSALWEAPVRRNRDEVAWLNFAQQVVPQAVPRLLGEDEQDCVFAMAFLPAEQYPVWKQQLMQGDIQPHTAEQVALTLAQLHAASANDSKLLSGFDHDADFVAIRLSPYFLYTAEKHPACATALHALVQQTLNNKRVLVHGDVSPKNILVGPHGPVLLDAECACHGDAAFDLAFLLTHLLLKCLHLPERTADYLHCFDVVCDSYLQRVDWEPADQLQARTCGLLAGMLLARVDGKSPVEYLTQPAQHDFIRSKTIPWLQHPPTQLAQMRQQWITS